MNQRQRSRRYFKFQHGLKDLKHFIHKEFCKEVTRLAVEYWDYTVMNGDDSGEESSIDPDLWDSLRSRQRKLLQTVTLKP